MLMMAFRSREAQSGLGEVKIDRGFAIWDQTEKWTCMLLGLCSPLCPMLPLFRDRAMLGQVFL